jgi:hypothetical protein
MRMGLVWVRIAFVVLEWMRVGKNMAINQMSMVKQGIATVKTDVQEQHQRFKQCSYFRVKSDHVLNR